ncbi:hypothetical protein ABIB50_001518 [Mucilaginibacter sp. UYCu711]
MKNAIYEKGLSDILERPFLLFIYNIKLLLSI